MLPLIFILCVGFLGLSEGAGVLPEGPLDAAIGGSVLFTTNLTPPETPFSSVTWNFAGATIGVSTSAGSNIAPAYQGRVTMVHSNISMELRSLTVNDSGQYGVTILSSTGSFESGTITLRVHAPVSNVTIDPETVNLVEFNDSLKLSCNSSGSSLSFLWIKDGTDVTTSDRVQITDGGKVLTIASVTRDDQGLYTCRVSNPVSSVTSGPANVTVYYGPDNMELTTSPPETSHAVGSNITLFCSAESRPSAQLTWVLNGSQLLNTGSELKLMNANVNQSGSYSCQAFNPQTLRYRTSEPSSIHILEGISGGSVNATNPPVEGESLNITCEASGSVWTRTWTKDGSDLSLTDNVKLHDNNRVLSFTTVTRNDDGDYICNISNPISSTAVTYSLIVNYGPENVQISGENQVEVGKAIKLSCTADSVPVAEFTWSLNGTQTSHSSSDFSKDNASSSDSGTYTCRARNDITGKSASAELTMTVTANLPISGGCSAGCIAGIVIACVIVVVVAIGVAYYFIRKNKRKSASTTRDGAQDNTGYANEDVSYADIRFVRHDNGASVQLGARSDTTDYAEVRVKNSRYTPSSPPTYDAHLQRAKRTAPQPGGRDSQHIS